MKINRLEIENVKRVKAVQMKPAPSGLTVIGGKNGQGKTSVLDAIAWALGGDRYRPSKAEREGSVIPPHLHIVMDNGLVVERKGKNSDLKVIDPDGRKGGQQLLNEFVEQLALDLPKFINSTSKEKAQTLLKIIGVGDKLAELEFKETEKYNMRRSVGQIADQKEKFAKEMIYYTDAPEEPVSAAELIKQQQDILTKNGENQRKRNMVDQLKHETERLRQTVYDLEKQLESARAQYSKVGSDLEIAKMSIAALQDKSTVELERNIENIEEINLKVRANLDKQKAEEDAQTYRNQYATLTSEIEELRNEKTKLLENADLPLPGLSVEEGELTYNGYKWDNMSGSEQLKVSTAIVRKLNPKCGFVLLDKLEQMDTDTLQEFGSWLESEGLQAIATRVSTGDECSLVIEDGYSIESISSVPQHTTWKAGEF